MENLGIFIFEGIFGQGGSHDEARDPIKYFVFK